MSSYFTKMLMENQFDKVMKEFTGSDKDEQNEDDGVTGEELVAEQNRQAAMEKERKARHAKVENEREEARQKIRDKYNIKKKDDPPTSSKNHHQSKSNDLITRIDNVNAKLEKSNGSEPQGSQIMKMTTDAFDSFKRKFGWN